MAVLGVDAVERAHARSERTLQVAAGDLVTPLARERARDLGIQVVTDGSTASARRVSGPPGAAPAASPPPRAPRAAPSTPSGEPPPDAYPPSNALLRRGAPLPLSLGGRDLDGDAPPSRVVVVGAGHVGQIAALRLCDADLFDEVVLVDVVDGLAAGIALDLTHSAALGHFRTRVRGATSIEQAGPAAYVVITAGRARQPGMSRSDLIETNAAIVGPIAAGVAAVSSDAVIVVVTNPLDEMTQHAWVSSGFPSERVIGMAGVLDTARFQALISLEGAGPADGVVAYALGSHGEEMVVPLSQTTAGGRPIGEVVGQQALTAVVDRTRGSGAEVVSLLKSGSAFMAPGMSAAHMIITMRRNTGEIVPAAVLARGEYGIDGVYVGLPVRLGPRGVREIVELPLTDSELRAVRDAAGRIRERLAALAPTG